MLENEVYVGKLSLCWKTKLMLEDKIYYPGQVLSCRTALVVKTWGHIDSDVQLKFHFERDSTIVTIT